MNEDSQTIASILAPRLGIEFSGRGLRLTISDELGEGTFAVFPAIDEEVGNIEIVDDGDEATVHLGDHAHAHFGCYEEDLSESDKYKKISDDVIRFLQDVFADKVQFYGTRWSGGFEPAGTKQGRISKLLFGPKKYFVWSGPLSPSE